MNDKLKKILITYKNDLKSNYYSSKYLMSDIHDLYPYGMFDPPEYIDYEEFIRFLEFLWNPFIITSIPKEKLKNNEFEIFDKEELEEAKKLFAHLTFLYYKTSKIFTEENMVYEYLYNEEFGFFLMLSMLLNVDVLKKDEYLEFAYNVFYVK